MAPMADPGGIRQTQCTQSLLQSLACDLRSTSAATPTRIAKEQKSAVDIEILAYVWAIEGKGFDLETS